MKHFAKLVLMFVLINISSVIFSQEKINVTPDPRLYECWSKEYVDDLAKNNPDVILYYNYYLDHSYFVSSLKAEKPVEGINIHDVVVKEGQGSGVEKFSDTKFDAKKFNPLKYDFQIYNQKYSTYIFKEAGIAINFYPIEVIANNFKLTMNKQ